jgi:hypothetical protein
MTDELTPDQLADASVIQDRMTERAVAQCMADGMTEEDARATVDQMWIDPPPTSLPTFEELGETCAMAPRACDPDLVDYQSPWFDIGMLEGTLRLPRADDVADGTAISLDDVQWASYCEGWLMGFMRIGNQLHRYDPRAAKHRGCR